MRSGASLGASRFDVAGKGLPLLEQKEEAMRSMSKTVQRSEIGDYTIRLKADGSIAIARKSGRLAVTDMGRTKDNKSFVEVR